MVRKTIRHAWLIVPVAALCTGTTASAVERDAFAVGWPLELAGNGGLHDVPLELDVYTQARALDELAVLDADGDAMPFYRVEAPAPEDREQRATLDVSAVYEQRADARGAVRIETEDESGRVAVTRPARGDEQRIVAFLVDARDFDARVSTLDLEWQPLERPFLMSVRIEHSTDLTRWRTVARESIAALVVDGEPIRHGRVPIAASERGYYRVSWDERVPDWRLERVELVGAVAGTETERLDIAPARIASPAENALDNAFYFDAGGALPVTHARLEFPDGYGWARARIGASTSRDGPYRNVTPEQLFYRVEIGGDSLSSPAAEVPRTEARYWRVSFAGEPRGDIGLELDMPREQLRFAAQGSAPYMLAGGTLLDTVGPDATFADVVAELDAAAQSAGTARLGSRIELGGAAALVPARTFPWQTATLWAVLILGAVLVVSMAVRLGLALRRG